MFNLIKIVSFCLILFTEALFNPSSSKSAVDENNSQFKSDKYITKELGTNSSLQKIRNDIDRVLSKKHPSTVAAILIFDPLTQDTLYKLNYTRSMIPASNTKLFTTATALNLMGGDFVLKTELLTDDFNLNDGVINGNLYLKGYGNSTFTENDMDSLIADIKKLGISRVTGDIIGDDTYFDEIYIRDDWIKDERANVKLPPISALVVDRNRKIVERKKGRRVRKYRVNIDNPPVYAANMLRDKLIENGIAVAKQAGKGTSPEGLKLISSPSIKLSKLVRLVNKHSDNFLAEVLFKTLGSEYSHKQGNSFYSTQAVLDFIEANTIYSQGTSVVDGSGISRFNQITPGAITGLLEKMYFDLVHFDDFYNSLSIAGIDGTLKKRFRGTFLEGNLRGKTGTLNGVSSLAGYLRTKSGEDLVFSIIFEFDKGSWNFYKDLEDEIVQIASNW